MKKNLFVGLLFLTVNTLVAQVNLVPNPSFEDTVQCPNGLGQVYNASFWVKPTVGSSDYFNSCAPGAINVPNAITGYQLARTGNAYAGIYTSFIGSNYREYIQVKLDSVLKPSHIYCAKFYVSLADTEKVACNNIGIYFSDTAVSSNLTTVLNFIPQITNNIFTNPLTDKILWTEVSGSFIAIGGENYITIGNFLNDANSDTVHVAGGSYPQGYYYIDDVSVIDCTGMTEGVLEPIQDGEISIYPNPSAGMFEVKSKNNKIKSVTLYNLLGELVYSSSSPSGRLGGAIDITGYANGLYFVEVQTEKGILRKKFIKQ